MSADNGIYILKTKDQYRVICAQAIENLWWSYVHNDFQKYPVPTRIVEYYGDSRYTRDFEKAQRVAFAMERSQPILEYGIRTIRVNKTWRQIVKEAKEMAKLEIEAIKKRGNEERWKWELDRLEKIVSLQ
jgi:hypothetical protein